MTPENFDRTLRVFQRQQPFRSFTVELVSGHRFEVDHPEALAFRGGAAVFFAPDGSLRIFDHEGASQFLSGRRRRPGREAS
jgi:hypothetical protein